MMQVLKICFIINPVAGGYKKHCERIIEKEFSNSAFEIAIKFTNSKGDAHELAKNAIKNNCAIVVAVGGDGTINEVASTLLNTNVALGIIPMGSGNGLARHHKISGNFKKALQVIKRNHQVLHDAVQINEFVSFNVSGIGFDAHVAHLFGKDGQRGLKTYAKLIISEFSSYKNFGVEIVTTTSTNSYEAMMVTFANSSQFGNNAYIAPQANTNDGLVDLVVLKKIPFWKLPALAMKVIRMKTQTSTHVKMLVGERFVINCSEEVPLHIDGEPCGFSRTFSVKAIKSVFKIIIP
jgi:diacylglycerol kinase (ATP)